MNRKTLPSLLLAAAAMTAGTLAVVHAQDADKAEKPHDHEHFPTTVHAKDGTAFKLDDKDAYPDPDGFKSMDSRVGYALGISNVQQIPMLSEDDFKPETFGPSFKKGMKEENEDYANGYSEGFSIVMRTLDRLPEDADKKAFIEGLVAAIKEEDTGSAVGYLLGNNFRDSELPVEVATYLRAINEGLADMKAKREKAAADAKKALEDAKKKIEDSKEGEDKPEDKKDQAKDDGKDDGKLDDNPDDGKPEDAEPATKLQLTDEQVQETITALQAFLQQREIDRDIKKGQDYIDGLKKEDGWKKTESGIAYKVVKDGQGESPDSNDIVTMDYQGTLIDGTEFDSSYTRGQKLVIPANRVIKGWTEVLQMMAPGSVYEVVIPYNLAYGEQGSPPRIPGYAALKFKMEMHSFERVAGPVPPKGDKKDELKPDKIEKKDGGKSGE